MKTSPKYLCPERIQIIRKSLNISQNEMAEKLGISPAMYCRIEKGERTISDKLLIKISQLLNINFKELQSLALADKINNFTKKYDKETINLAFKESIIAELVD